MSATSATTSIDCVRWRPPAPAPLLPVFIAALRSGRRARRAGSRPTSGPVAIETASENSSTCTFSPGANAIGIASDVSRRRTSTPNAATTRLASPPSAARIRFSVSTCRTSRPPLAPSAARTASSCWRWQPRASSRLATLAQATSSTSDTAPSRIISGVRVASPITSVTGCTTTLHFCLNEGYSPLSCRLIVFSSASAWATLVRDASRPNTPAQCGERFARSVPGTSTAGMKKLCSFNIHAPFGRTPITVRGTSSRTMVRPTIVASALKRERQSSSVIITTSVDPPGRSSSGRNPRPSSGGRASTFRNSCETSMPVNRTGGAPSLRRLALTMPVSISASNCVWCARQSRNAPPDVLFGLPFSSVSDTITSRSGSG